MAYAIMRLEKLSDLRVIAGRVNHSYRHLYEDKQDRAKLIYEKFSVEQGKAVSQYFKQLDENIHKATGKKVRKDAVRTYEIVLTASPEFFKDLPQDKFNEWIERNKQFLFNTFGKDNVISIVLHLDETTPHLHAFVSTYDPEKNNYNAQKWTGDRYKLSQLQDIYYGYVQDLGLQRGVSSKLTRRKHLRLRDFWKKLPTINELMDEINELNKKLAELEEQNTRLKQQIREQKDIRQLEKQIQELQRQIEQKDRTIQEYRDIINKQITELETLAKQYKELKKYTKQLEKENELQKMQIHGLLNEIAKMGLNR